MLPTGNLSNNDNFVFTVQEDGIFCFEHNDKVKYAAYMPLEKIDDTDVINVGHLSAEFAQLHR
jgi:hypothetical protein